MPTRLIAATFGVSQSTVRRHRSALGIEMTWQDSVALPDSKFKSPDFAKARSETSRKSWLTKRERINFNL